MLPTVSPKWRKAGCNGHQMANAQDISSFLPPLPDTVICLQNIHSFSSLLNKIKTPMGGRGREIQVPLFSFKECRPKAWGEGKVI